MKNKRYIYFIMVIIFMISLSFSCFFCFRTEENQVQIKTKSARISNFKSDMTMGGLCTIKFQTNGGSQVQDVSINLMNRPILIPTTMPVSTKLGYVLDGWYRESNFATKVEKYADLDLKVDTTYTLYAKWKEEVIIPPTGRTYIIKHNTNGGNTITDKTITLGTNPDTWGEIAIPAKTGYEFKGWYKESTFVNQVSKYKEISGSTGNTIMIYAKWEKNTVPPTSETYVIKHNTNGGSLITDKTITVGTNPDTWGKIATPTKTGYEFKGWYKESNFENKVSQYKEISGSAGSTITIYAKWQKYSAESGIDNTENNKDKNETEKNITDTNTLKGDNTIANKKLSNTGIKVFFPIILIALFGMIGFYSKYKNLRGIK